jgi:hypothetical protein
MGRVWKLPPTLVEAGFDSPRRVLHHASASFGPARSRAIVAFISSLWKQELGSNRPVG